MTLAHLRVRGEGLPTRWVLFLHGIFGAGRNWASFARRLVEERPEWSAVLVDLRLHGASRGLPPPHTLGACAADVARLADSLDASDLVLLGHSFGGKVALVAVRDELLPRLRQAWIVESTPESGGEGGDAAAMLAALRALPPVFTDRHAAVSALEGRGFARGVAEWMATNLEPRSGGLGWRLDLDGIGSLLRDFRAADLWPVVESPGPGVDLHFVKAETSGVLTPDACERIEASEGARLHRVAGGHWVNVDDPDGLLRLLAAHLP